jgi:hypothetical protein
MADEEFEIDLYGDASNDQAEDNHQGDGPGYDGEQANGGDESWADERDKSHSNDGQPAHPAPTHGVKRKGESDDRPTDPNSTTALLLSDLSWWNTDDEIRGWANEAGCEDELRDITFSEHKVNGKSKGLACTIGLP